ncbi:GNAT family N-acetyltransferase [Streptomyces sp. NBC_00582]|uniref:GNAT family N-acetyltransferase n=1 Tax=Streptomyces sp. NBC_00582 TaxID=2975783 RepID=UPI002E8120F1|nr:GNAT family N-acetyltransferase [Streptomyces sp. NBC_00582]WUB60859.1 GNAT family N-acetyltransferase [Streptomyces sp. NBC_00582]
MTARDWHLVDGFHQHCSQTSLLRRWGRTRFARRDLSRLLAHAECWIGLDADEEPVGLVCVGPVSGQEGVVDLGLQVADARQCQGIGTALARHAADAARFRGAHTLTAYTQASHTAVIRILDRLGPARHVRDGPYVEVHVALDPNSPDRPGSPQAATG